MKACNISFPCERTKTLLINQKHQILFGDKSYGVTNPWVFNIFASLLADQITHAHVNHETHLLKNYSSFLALKTIYIEEEKPESLLSAYLEIDLAEKIKKEFAHSDNGFLKIVAYRNVPLKHHRNIRVIEILYEKTLSLFLPLIKMDCPNEFLDDKGMEISEERFHKVFDVIQGKINAFQGNLIHELNCRFAEIKIDVYSSHIKPKIHSFFKQHIAKHFFYDLFSYMEQYLNKHVGHFSLEKIWSDYLLSSFLRIMGNEMKAKEKLEGILDLFQRIYGQEQIEISDILMSLSNIIANSNKNQAIELMERALKLRSNFLHKEHLKVSYVYMSLGSLNLSLKQLEKANFYFQKALKGFEKHYSEDYPWDSLGYTLYSLGNICMEKENYTTAFYYLKSSMNVYNNYIIPNDIMVASIMGILTKICIEHKNFTDGYSYSLQALKIIKHSFGEGNEKYKSMKKSIKESRKYMEINARIHEAIAIDRKLRKAKIFKRKDIINDILNHFN